MQQVRIVPNNFIFKVIDQVTQLSEVPGDPHTKTGCCPFCLSQNMQFNVSGIYDSYLCWDCGVSGDKIKFVMAIQKCTSSEAITYIKSLIEIPIQKTNQDFLQSLDGVIAGTLQSLQLSTNQFQIDNLLDQYNWLLRERKSFIELCTD